LPTLGGNTELNTAVELAESGVLKKYNLRLLGANLQSIMRAEERDREILKRSNNAATDALPATRSPSVWLGRAF